MELIVPDTCYKVVCSGCLSIDRNFTQVNQSTTLFKLFRSLLADYAGENLEDSLSYFYKIQLTLCWECVAMLTKFKKFKQQVQTAYEHLKVLSLTQTQENLDHTYMAQSLSPLEYSIKNNYDRVYIDYQEHTEIWPQPYITITTQDVKNESFEVSQALRDNITLGTDDPVLEVPELVLKNPVTGALSHIVVGTDALVSSVDYNVKGEMTELIVQPQENMQSMKDESKSKDETTEGKSGFITEYMSQEDMLASREELKKKVRYVSSVYKCELCILEFYLQQQVEEHFDAAHSERPGCTPCKICYVYVESSKLQAHIDKHYIRYICKLCSRVEYSIKLISLHVKTHLDKKLPNSVIQIGDSDGVKKRRKKKSQVVEEITNPKPGDLRKLLSKTTIVGYKCLECDLFFKNSRARKNHVARCHREGLQCDHCKKRFVNRTTLVTHLRLHEGPLPREKCPICNKMVRVIQLKYHIQRHQNSSRYECSDCNKVFSHLATYQAHLKYSRAHASDTVFKFQCPMCHKGYPTKDAMQDHFNYQHLGKTTHKCPICSKPIASKANVEKHIMRVHREKKEKPKNHMCNLCGKKFSDKKALNQHEVIHSMERPLTCEICSQSFKQKASLYTHKKRVHKVQPQKRVVEFMDRDGS
ncbi:zinc finger protein 92 isoform X1 [Pieris rapae]|uniref:zinc finger protein 92 isoform X1 n=2 Tax=Pieris rapae TaxID=64459 RepID=UPI001E27B120|nr:zinc finger protein 92 isoform X1 [Pieris rapae]